MKHNNYLIIRRDDIKIDEYTTTGDITEMIKNAVSNDYEYDVIDGDFKTAASVDDIINNDTEPATLYHYPVTGEYYLSYDRVIELVECEPFERGDCDYDETEFKFGNQYFNFCGLPIEI